MPRSATAAPPVAVELGPTADATVRAGNLSSTAYGTRLSLSVRTAASQGQHKTAGALLRCATVLTQLSVLL